MGYDYFVSKNVSCVLELRDLGECPRYWSDGEIYKWPVMIFGEIGESSKGPCVVGFLCDSTGDPFDTTVAGYDADNWTKCADKEEAVKRYIREIPWPCVE